MRLAEKRVCLRRHQTNDWGKHSRSKLHPLQTTVTVLVNISEEAVIDLATDKGIIACRSGYGAFPLHEIAVSTENAVKTGETGGIVSGVNFRGCHKGRKCVGKSDSIVKATTGISVGRSSNNVVVTVVAVRHYIRLCNKLINLSIQTVDVFVFTFSERNQRKSRNRTSKNRDGKKNS